MGRLVPVFREQDGRMLFQGEFKDEASGRTGYLETGHINRDQSIGVLAEIKWFSDASSEPRDHTNVSS